MKKIICFLLLTLGFTMAAQNKKVVARTGEQVTVERVMTTTERDALQPVPYIGFLIFNTTTDCHEFYNGAQGWYNYCWQGYVKNNDPSSNGTAVVSSYNCAGTDVGAMTVGKGVNGVTHTITADVATAGTYNIKATVNGVTFAGSGTFAATGSQDIVLTATGTPATASTSSFALNTTPSCSFDRTVIGSYNATSGGTADIALVNCSANQAGNMTEGTAVSGVTQTIAVNVITPGSYVILTDTKNGIYFSGSGTFATAGLQNVVLTASGTPTAAGSPVFTLSTTPNCTFNRTIDANISSSTGGTAVVSGYSCSTGSTGTMVIGTAVSGVTQTITANVTKVGTYTITATANGVTFTGSGTFATTGSQNIVLTATGTPVAIGNNDFVLSTTPGCSFNRTTNSNISATSNGTAIVSSYDCSGGALTGTLTETTAVSGVTKTIIANVATTGTYSITTTANGVTFAGTGAFAGTGNQNITLTATGTPAVAGSNNFVLNTTPNCSFSVITNTIIPTVLGAAGKTWMAMNLGATRVATSSTDYLAYGDLYQWGRGADGHEKINWTSGTAGTPVNGYTNIVSSTDTAVNSLFIDSGSAGDWRSPKNDALWQGYAGTNNPCPAGFRLPTDPELTAEFTNNNITNLATAYSSNLKLVAAGWRGTNYGAMQSIGTYALLASSTTSGTLVKTISITPTGVIHSDWFRGNGHTVRCMKD